MTNDDALALIAAGQEKIAAGQKEILLGATALQANMLPPPDPVVVDPPPVVIAEPVPPSRTVTVSSLADLLKAAAAAVQPTTIKLAAGDYGMLVLKNLTQTALTLALAGATLQGLRVLTSRNIDIRGAKLVMSAAGSMVQVADSSGVSFTDCASSDGTTYGFSALRSQKVAFIRCRAERVKDGFQANGCDGLVIKDGYVRRTAADGATLAACSNVHIDGFDASEIGAGGHPDVIQFFTKGTTVSSENILIENVRYVRGVGASQAQGVFLTDQVGTLPYRNVVIRNCRIEGAMWNGIMVANGENIAITDNAVIPYEDMDSWVRLINVRGCVLAGNQYTQVLQEGDNTGLAIKGTTIIKPIPVPAAA